MFPVCSKCIYLTNKPERFRKCPCVPIFHKDMLCSNERNAIKDSVAGVSIKPFCEEANKHGECLAYYPIGLEKPEIFFEEGENILTVKGTSDIILEVLDKSGEKNADAIGNLRSESGENGAVCTVEILHSCKLRARCIKDGVYSDCAEKTVEIADAPEILFDKETNTVSIKSYNRVFFSADGSEVTEDSKEYTEPFVIDHNTTIKARSSANSELSKTTTQYCVSIEAPVIKFDEENNIVSIEADDTILYSTDGSDIYDDAQEYDGDFVIEKNTTVKAACIVDGELSEQTELECKVPDAPEIEYDNQTHKVTITAENSVRYTTDGNDVKKKDSEYTLPFVITETCTVKAVSFVDSRISEQTKKKCVYVEAPEITFDEDTYTVSISDSNTEESKILYSKDGSTIYDDADEYTSPFVLDENATIKACCIIDEVLSKETSLTCQVPSKPEISFNSTTGTVTITGNNTILYTTDGSNVKKKDSEYKSSFKITATTTVKAKEFVNNKLSEQAEMECVVE